ncbi:MAG: class I SAM-dependent methyltransferase [Bacteroidales bacterium]|nr:class I SAM-dependent methyltransferase [Clostridium sp.]MCM1202953.1 class I SAM-dependent methyltransferase [Bacteroidales bacterium]
MRLSKRMEAVVSMVSPQSFTVADVGCDHAYVSIALLEQAPERKVIAMDVRKGPLEIAAGNIAEAKLGDSIELRLSDGLEKLSPDEADTVILAGMGGLLIKRILEEGMAVLLGERPPTLILQPQSDIWEVRIFLQNHAYHIVQEIMLVDDGKYYTVIKASPGMEKGKYSDTEYRYGRYNLKHQDKVLYTYLKKEKKALEEIRGKIPQKKQRRLQEIDVCLERNAEAFCYYEGGGKNDV